MSTLDGVNGTVYDTQQNKQPFSIYADSTILTNGQSIGLALIAEASSLSLCAIIVVFILIARNLLRYRKVLPNGDWKLLRTPADIYMLSLFLYDIVQAVGGILNVRWAHDGVVTTGPYCTAQGIIKQIGKLGVPLLTLILAIHTFTIALWNVGAEARYFAFSIVAFTCLFVALWAGISNGVHKDFEMPTPYWCSIGPNKERLAGQYVWIWIALFASVAMYIPVYFWMKGHLSVDGDKWYKFRLVKSDVEYSKRRATLGILLYPLAYSLVVIPLSISRWLLFSHKDVPSAAIFFGDIMFSLSGAINVLLFLTVRPHLLLFTPPNELGESSVEPDISTTIFLDMTKHKRSPQVTDDV
ncbi:hypothetical protein EDB92DRAFT_519363 [Lactarius akahatsu]|uniref:Glucose receptor Git3 N-terminal domain-containing protein n=1 Tax=Lactarius akahatsu TaxID=416441 RepID=A0AAD4LH89_9AGAM|nr:hypothetical protein EDB92DRAFT_519363 [Lactarius akahatsu]